MNDPTKTKRIAPSRAPAPPNFRVHPDFDPKDLSNVRRAPQPVADPNEAMATGIVADGRCVEGPHPSGEKHLVGFSVPDEKYIHALVQKRWGPGETVTLPISEIRRLTELGFLRDTDAAPIARSTTGMPA